MQCRSRRVSCNAPRPILRKETFMNNLTYAFSVEAFVPVLKSLAHILDKGADHARTAKTDPDTLADARLAPDMFPLSTQVQFACHQAREACARLSGREAPTLERKEQ